MANINYVIEGKYKNEKITSGSILYINGEPISKRAILSYTVIDEANKDQYSFWKGALGVTLLGGWGAVAGIGGKKKKEYLIAIEWVWPKNAPNNSSLVILDEKYYQIFIRSMF